MENMYPDKRLELHAQAAGSGLFTNKCLIACAEWHAVDGEHVPRQGPGVGGVQRAHEPQNHGRGGPDPHALPLRALRLKSAVRHALRHHPRRACDWRSERHRASLQPLGQ